jgi:hypothetical protein
VLRHDPDWTAKREWGDKGNRWKFYNRDSVASRTAPKRPHTRFRPVDYVWRNYQHYRAKVPKAVIRQRTDEWWNRRYAENPVEAIRDKAWRDTSRREERERVEGDVAWHRLLRDSDDATRTRLLDAVHEIGRDFDAWKAWMDARRRWMTHPDVWLKRYQKRARTERETHTPPSKPIHIPPPSEAERLAAMARALVRENDPDTIRDGLGQLARGLDRIAAALDLITAANRAAA